MFAFLSRVLLFFFAISVIRSVVQAVVRAFGNSNTPQPPAGPARKTGPASEGDASTLLHQDPVCGTYVAAGSSLRKICKGQVYHFCSEECRNRYVA